MDTLILNELKQGIVKIDEIRENMKHLETVTDAKIKDYITTFEKLDLIADVVLIDVHHTFIEETDEKKLNENLELLIALKKGKIKLIEHLEKLNNELNKRSLN